MYRRTASSMVISYLFSEARYPLLILISDFKDNDMQRTFKTILPLTVLLVVVIPLLQCKQVYVSPYTSPATGYLVVEGYISGNSETSFTLSRTIKLSGDTTNPQEVGASVQVEGDDNSVYPLTEAGSGINNTGSLPLHRYGNNPLRVHTPNNEGEFYQ